MSETVRIKGSFVNAYKTIMYQEDLEMKDLILLSEKKVGDSPNMKMCDMTNDLLGIQKGCIIKNGEYEKSIVCNICCEPPADNLVSCEQCENILICSRCAYRSMKLSVMLTDSVACDFCLKETKYFTPVCGRELPSMDVYEEVRLYYKSMLALPVDASQDEYEARMKLIKRVDKYCMSPTCGRINGIDYEADTICKGCGGTVCEDHNDYVLTHSKNWANGYCSECGDLKKFMVVTSKRMSMQDVNTGIDECYMALLNQDVFTEKNIGTWKDEILYESGITCAIIWNIVNGAVMEEMELKTCINIEFFSVRHLRAILKDIEENYEELIAKCKDNFIFKDTKRSITEKIINECMIESKLINMLCPTRLMNFYAGEKWIREKVLKIGERVESRMKEKYRS